MRTSLQQSQRKLLEGERMATIGRMASSISHDLRHQLAAILANAEFLSERRSEDERVELYQELRAAVFQMTDLIDSLLEFSRPRESLRLAWVRLNEVLERAIQTVRARPEFRAVEIHVRGDAIDGWFDNNKLQRAFQNLVLNACEATERDHGKVTFGIRRRGGTVEIAVQDNGHGIPDHLRDHIFEPFVSYGKENGTGLGLTVVHKIVVDHGGEVRVQETSPGGTTLLVSLPLLPSPQQPIQASTAHAALVRTDPSE
jgi:signal transduction histidine kinase